MANTPQAPQDPLEPFVQGVRDPLQDLINPPGHGPNVLERLINPGGFNQPPPPAPNPPTPNTGFFTEFGRGLQRGVRELGADFTAFAATTTALVGADAVSQDLTELAQLQERAIRESIPAPAVGRFEDIHNLSDFALLTANLLGEQIPVIASIIAGGGLSGLVGRLIGRGLMSVAAGEVNLLRFGRIASGVGAVGTAGGFETGNTALEQLDVQGKIDPGVALVAGAAKGALEAIVPTALGARFGLTSGLAGDFLGRIAGAFDGVVARRLATAGAAGATEAVTEALQETVDVAARSFIDDNYDALGPEGVSRIANAAGGGGLIGFLFGGILGGHGVSRGDSTQDPEFNLEEQEGRLALPPPRKELPPPTPALPGPPPSPEAPIANPDEVINLPGEVDTSLPSPPLPTSTSSIIVAPAEPQMPSATGVGLDVLNPFDAAEAYASLHESATRRAYQIDEPLNVEDASTSLLDLPANASDITGENPRVVTTETVKRTAALRLAKAAIKARDLALRRDRKDERIGIGPDLEEAQKLYAQAIKAGFRYIPQEGDSYTVLRDVKVKEVEPPAFTPTSHGMYTVYSDTTGKLLQEEGLPTVRTPYSDRFGKPKVRIYAVRQDRLGDSAAISSTSSFDLGDAIGKAADQIGLPDPQYEFNPELTDGQISDLIETSPDLRLLSWANRDTVIQKVRDYITLRRQTKSWHEAQDKATDKVVQAGLIINPSTASLQHRLRLVGPIPPAALREVPGAGISRHRFSPPAGDYVSQKIIQGLTSSNAKKVTIGKAGVAWDEASHKMGTAEAISLTPLSIPEKQKLLQMVKLYNHLLKLFNLKNYRLVVSLDGFGHEDFPSADILGAGGYFTPSGGDLMGIVISRKRLQTESGIHLIDAVTHEFGHFLQHALFKHADHGVQQKILSAYNRALIRGSFLGIDTYEKNFFSPSLFAYDIFGVFNFKTPILETGRSFISNKTMDETYWFAFDEWFANQMARWATVDEIGLSVVEKFFKHAGQMMKTFFKEVKKFVGVSTKNFAPTEEFASWINSIIDQKLAKQELHAITYDTAEITSAQANTDQITKEDPGAPHQPESYHIDLLMDKLNIPSKLRKQARAGNDKFSWIMKWGWNLFQIAKVNPHISQLQDYKELASQWYAYKMGWVSRGDGRVREWKALGKKQGDALSKLLFDLDSQNYRTGAEVKENINRQPTEAELQALVKKHGLTPETFEVYQRVKEDFDAFLSAIEQAVIRDVKRTFNGSPSEMIELAEVAREFETLRQKPYFPHSRFGKYSVVVKNEKGRTIHMEQFATRHQATKGAQRLKKAFPKDRVRGPDIIPDSIQPFRGLPPSLLKSIRNKLNLSAEQRVWLDRLIVEMAPTKSFRKRLQRRENIPGFSLDGMRSYANYFFHGANYLARVEYGDRMQDTITNLQEDISSREGPVDKIRGIQEFMQGHLENIMNPKPDWAQARSFAFQWYLGFNPASAVVNFTQIPLVAWPYLSARFGDLRALNALQKSVFSLQNLYRGKENPSDQELKAIELGIQQGFLDESQATELAGTAEGSNLQRLLPGTKLERFFMHSAHWSGFLFQQSEKINRRVVFRAAYRLAQAHPDTQYLQELRQTEGLALKELLRNGWNEADALAFLAGRDAVNATQFQYAAHARPRFMQGRKGTLFTFFMFVQSMVWFASHSPGRTRFLLMMLLAGGLMGLPGADDLAEISKFMARRLFGKDFDVERELREIIIGLLGDEVPPDLILHGTSRVGFGIPQAFDAIGIPFPHFDLSANVSLGQIIPGINQLGAPSGDFDSKFSNAVSDASGAFFGIGINLAKALTDDSLPIDDFKRWERAMPKAIKNIMRTARYIEEGRERTRTGATVANFDASDPDQLADIVGQSLGFGSTRLNRQWDRRQMQRETEQYWVIRRGILMKQFDHAFVVNDLEAKHDVLMAIKRFNNDVPFGLMRIRRSDLRNSRKERTRQRHLNEAGLSPQRRMRPLSRQVGRLFPESQPESKQGEIVDVEDIHIR